MTLAVLAVTVLLAAANGSNDDPKGVATLGGSGVTRYRHALTLGVAGTFAGALVSLHPAGRLTKLFSAGIVTAAPTPALALAVLVGAAAWVLLATAARLPVSTTHALVGGLVGAGLALGPGAVARGSLVPRVVEPLLVSIVVAYAGSAVLNLVPGRVPECACVTIDQPALTSAVDGPAAMAAATIPALTVRTGTVADCRAHGVPSRGISVTLNGLHWLTAAAASFARGLNVDFRSSGPAEGVSVAVLTLPV